MLDLIGKLPLAHIIHCGDLESVQFTGLKVVGSVEWLIIGGNEGEQHEFTRVSIAFIPVDLVEVYW